MAPVPTPRVLRPALAVAGITSVAAGLVHVAAAGNHEGHTILVWMFALCAVAQIGWGTLVAVRSGHRVLLAGAVINGGAVAVWVLSAASASRWSTPLPRSSPSVVRI